MQNKFSYSLDNKRYHTWNYYLKTKYQAKVFKVPLDAHFTCPNRDGTCGVGGCTFCGDAGSGEQIVESHQPLQLQFTQNLERMKLKWPHGKAIAYFQAYTNTYCSLQTLKDTIEPIFYRDDVLALSLATRADCLSDDILAYLDSLTKYKEVWVELGLQSIHDETATLINRGHDYACFEECVQRLKHTNLKVCVHLMNSLPNESKQDMIDSAQVVGALPIQAIKIHMLYLDIHTLMAKQYLEHPFPMLSKDDYVDVVIQQLQHIPEHIIIQRVTGDGNKDTQIGSEWMFRKVDVINSIDKEMKLRNVMQGDAL